MYCTTVEVLLPLVCCRWSWCVRLSAPPCAPLFGPRVSADRRPFPPCFISFTPQFLQRQADDLYMGSSAPRRSDAARREGTREATPRTRAALSHVWCAVRLPHSSRILCNRRPKSLPAIAWAQVRCAQSEGQHFDLLSLLPSLVGSMSSYYVEPKTLRPVWGALWTA